MTEHRYPCQVPAPDPVAILSERMALLVGHGHRHGCGHDVATHHPYEMVEHRCDCGLTWTERVEVDGHRSPPDLSWIKSTCDVCGDRNPMAEARAHRYSHTLRERLFKRTPGSGPSGGWMFVAFLAIIASAMVCSWWLVA